MYPDHPIWIESREFLSRREPLPYGELSFSRRVLSLHLNQNTDQASRRPKHIKQQISWLVKHLMPEDFLSVLHLGCGPGCVAADLAKLCKSYLGVDIGPAAIQYAKSQFLSTRHVEFRQADVRYLDSQSMPKSTMVLLTYETINQFHPQDIVRIFRFAYENLVAGGVLVFEIRNPIPMRRAQYDYYAKLTDHSIFSDGPHFLEIESGMNHNAMAYISRFHVRNGLDIHSYNSIVWLYSIREFKTILGEANFRLVSVGRDHAYETDNPFTGRNPILIARSKTDLD